MSLISRRAVTAGLVSTPLMPRQGLAAPRSRLIDRRWARTGTTAEPDHGAWDAILGAHLRAGGDGLNRFDYAAASLSSVAYYVQSLERVDPTTLRSGAAFSYWVNLYNALTVRTVLENRPVESIRNIGGSLFSPGPWRDKRVRVAGAALSLDDIEHGILRPVWRDARVHYALNCAALGCPNLAPRAYTGSRLVGMLENGARAFVNHPRGARIGRGGLITSSIYHWFKEDFGGTDAGVIAHLRSYAQAPLRGDLGRVSRIDRHEYNWRLNKA